MHAPAKKYPTRLIWLIDQRGRLRFAARLLVALAPLSAGQAAEKIPFIPLPPPANPAAAVATSSSAPVTPRDVPPPALFETYRVKPEFDAVADTATLRPALDPLTAPVKLYRVLKTPVADALQSLTRTYGLVFQVDPAIKGELTLELRDVSLRELIDVLARSLGCH